jgi:glycosyltransferase involved in cell wall biosynthesis
LVARPALRLSLPVSLSRAGVAGAQARYGVAATYVPYPLRDLRPPKRARSLLANEPLEIVWVGRLYPEKDPLSAVAVVERVRLSRDATLELYGEGILADALERLARDRPWVSVRGSRSWAQIQEVQEGGHLCLSTSLRDATQIGILEPLSRGIPVVSTRVGDAPRHYVPPALRSFCVEPTDLDAAAAAILELASTYDRYRDEFAANGRLLRARHRRGRAHLASLVEPARSSRRSSSIRPGDLLVTGNQPTHVP